MPDMSKVHDQFRERSIGDRTAPFNSKSATDNFHIDRSRLGVHDEFDPEAKNEWGGKGKTVEKSNSIMDNVRAGIGDLKFKSSSRDVHAPDKPTNEGGCCPSPFPGSDRNPLMRRKGD